MAKKAAVKEEVQTEKPKVKLSQEIWDNIKDIDLKSWGLNGQYLHKAAKPLILADNELYLKLHKSATLAFIEEALNGRGLNGRKYVVSQTKDYTVIGLE